MKEQTIYSYKLLYRFRWRLIGYLAQIVSLFALLAGASYVLLIPYHQLIVSLAVIVLIPILHFIVFRFYAYVTSSPLKPTPDTLVSPWWGAGTAYPISLSFFRGAETSVCIGSLLVPAGLFVWLPLSYGVALAVGAVVLTLPRFLALLASIRQPKNARVKYEIRSIAFLLTDL
ncbi:hypothetical protein [Brevibacillus dissolubilis]|uniref:hypothetical protein n=1 Tax=Brevibacillus dissolubilis TaxID=1844116 RepID=UPI001116CBA5|nr:hypothetical protein [Brevibacillus dissolubilis]